MPFVPSASNARMERTNATGARTNVTHGGRLLMRRTRLIGFGNTMMLRNKVSDENNTKYTMKEVKVLDYQES